MIVPMDELRRDEARDMAGALADRVLRHAPEQGRAPTAVPGLDLFRWDEPSPLRCSIYHPCLIIVAQGRKVGFLGGERYEYSPSTYLVLPVTLPMESRVLEATPDRPFLSFAVHIDPTTLGQIMVDSGEGPPVVGELGQGVAVSRVDAGMADAALRLAS